MNIRCLYDELVPIQVLKDRFHPDNRNAHPPEQIERFAEIMAYQGVRSPVKISNMSGFITSGHGRVLSAEFNKWDKFPVNYQDYDNYDQEYADVQSDNAIASWAEYNFAGVNMDIGSGRLGPINVDLLGIRGFTVDRAEKVSTVIGTTETKTQKDRQLDDKPIQSKGIPIQLSLYYDKGQYETIINKLDTLIAKYAQAQYSDIIFTLVMKA